MSTYDERAQARGHGLDVDVDHEWLVGTARAVTQLDSEDVARRATTSEIIHDKFFIPGVVTASVFLLIVLFSAAMILRKKPKPPGVRWAAPQTRLDPEMQARASTSAHGHGPAPVYDGPPPGGPDDGSRRLSNIQRKPIPDTPAESTPYTNYAGYPGYQNQPGNLYRPQTEVYAGYPQNQNQNFNQSQNPYQPPYPPNSTYAQNASRAPYASAAPGPPGATRQMPAGAAAPYPAPYPAAGPVRESVLSTDQSMTQVGSEKDYYPGGYGKIQAQKQQQYQQAQAQASAGGAGSGAAYGAARQGVRGGAVAGGGGPGAGVDVARGPGWSPGSPGSPGEEEEYFDAYGGIEQETARSRGQVRR